MADLILAVTLLQSGLLSLQDLKFRRIYLLDALFLGIFLYLRYPACQNRSGILISFGTVTTLTLLKKYLEKKRQHPVFGLGDALILSLLLPFISLENLPLYLCLSGILGTLYGALRPKERQQIPLVFILLLSFWMIQFSSIS